MRLLCALALLLVLPMTACGPSPSSAASAPAQAPHPPSPPAGWLAGPVQGGFVVMSPEPDASKRIVLTLLPVAPAGAPLKDWFGNQALGLAQSYGHVTGATDTQVDDAVLSRVVKVTTQAGLELRSGFAGSAAAHGFQMSVVMIPPGVSDDDPRLQTISNYIDQ